MPDNKNPPENGKLQKPRIKKEIIRRGLIIECQHPDCNDWAISLSPYCWNHTEDKNKYIRKLAKWVNEEKSMERFILIGVDLSGATIYFANLSEARLDNANLSGAKLDGADLSGAFFIKASLSGAFLVEANLSKAVLSEANLSEADLTGANLSAALLNEANLTNAYLNWAKLTRAIALYKNNFNEKITLEEKKDAEHYKESYLTVKNYFIQSGLYDDASWAAFRERTLERIALAHEIKPKLVKGLLSWLWWKTVFKWFGSKAISLLNGYGERPWRVIISSGLIVTFFSIMYYIFKCIQSYPMEKLHRLDYLYFSIVTFTTLGYGDIRPLAAPWARMVASGEAFIGAFMIALFVLTLARRYVAR